MQANPVLLCGGGPRALPSCQGPGYALVPDTTATVCTGIEHVIHQPECSFDPDHRPGVQENSVPDRRCETDERGIVGKHLLVRRTEDQVGLGVPDHIVDDREVNGRGVSIASGRNMSDICIEYFFEHPGCEFSVGSA